MRLFTALAAAMMLAGVADAADRHVEIVNQTGMTLTKFYASNTGTRSWEEDILGRDTLDDGESIDVNINDGIGACKFDFKAVFENGKSIKKGNIDVCKISSFTYMK